MVTTSGKRRKTETGTSRKGARWLISAPFGLFVAAVAAGPGSAEEMQWHTGTFTDGQDNGGQAAYLAYGIPETDDAQFNATCSAKSGNRIASAVLGYNTGGRGEGAKVIVKFFDGNRAVYQKSGRVSGTKAEEGISGVTFSPSAQDDFWQVLSQGGTLGYRIDGGATATISLRGAADPIRTFTETCRSIFDGTYAAGPEVPTPEFGQPSFSPPQSPPAQSQQPQVAVPAPQPQPAAPQPMSKFAADGNTVRMLSLGLTAFVQRGPGAWVEVQLDSGVVTMTLQELGRNLDEIVLMDPATRIQYRFVLTTGEFFVGPEGGPLGRSVYSIVEAAPTAQTPGSNVVWDQGQPDLGQGTGQVVTGQTVKMIDFGPHALVEVVPDQFVAVDKAGWTKGATFVVQERAPTYILLLDYQSRMQARIDFSTGQLLQSREGKPLQAVGQVVSASAEARIRGSTVAWDAPAAAPPAAPSGHTTTPTVALPALAQPREFLDITSLSRWMGGIVDSASIASVNIPGTHDSGADYGCPTAFYSAYAKAQNDDIRPQLDKGIRYLDIRLRRAGSQFTIHHGQCYQQKNFDSVLAQVAAFLAANPTEFVLMRVKEEHSAMDNSENFAALFKRYQDQHPGIWYDITPTSVPKVGDVRGKIVILDDAGLGKGIAYSGPLVATQDEYYLGTAGKEHLEKKWHYVTGHLVKARTAKPGDKIFINHLSATGLDAGAGSLVAGFFGAGLTPADFADSVFPKLEKILGITKNRGYYGVFPMDFPTARVIGMIILSNPYYINK